MYLRPIICIVITITALMLLTFTQHATERASVPAIFSGVPLKRPTLEKYRSPGDRHKVKVGDRTLVAQIVAEGGGLISDYGTFSFLQVNSAVADLVQKRGGTIADENNLILLNSGAIDTTVPEAQAARKDYIPSGKQMRLIQFAAPIRPEWYAALEATGARIVSYIPNNAYLVYGQQDSLQRVQTLAATNSAVQWDGQYSAANKIDPAVNSQPVQSKKDLVGQMNLSVAGNEQFTIQLVADPLENAETLALIEQSRLEPIIKQDQVLGYVNVTVAMPREAIRAISDRGDVVSIQQWVTPQKFDERQDQILAGNLTGNAPTPGDYLAYLASHGFVFNTPSSFAVNISDSGIDNATTTPNHFGLYTLGDPTNPANSRIVYNRLVGTPNSGSSLMGCDGHGNLNSHIIGAYVPGGGLFSSFPHADASGFRYGLGVAPFVKIGSSVIFDPTTFTSPTYQNLESQAYRDGSRISSNSWGIGIFTYTADAQQYDALVRDAQPDTGCSLPNCISTPGNQEYVIVFAAGNLGVLGANHIATPATGKNVISVGAAENVHPFGGPDGCSFDDTGADNANDIATFSSRGPTSDSRFKPDIMAPGTHVSGGVPQSAIASPTGNGNGSQLGCFTGSDVCGGPSSSKFWPLSQQWYTASRGTSQSAPAIAGVAAIYRQFFINNGLTPPSPALTKALLMNSARYMTGTGANDTLPSSSQGMGEANLNNFFDIFAGAHTFHDEFSPETFTASGQEKVVNGSIGSNAKPFRVTLAWTDAPGPTSGDAFVNNLDLEVTVGGNTYKGNVFSGASSVTGGTADARNNVESVFLPAGASGTFTVKVKATNIAGDGVPNSGGPLDQDFALVIYNGAESGAPTINAVGVTRQAGSAVSNSTIATVNDVESGPGGVTVTVNGGASTTVNGVTVSNIVNTSGTVTADVVAACGATNASFTLTATDGGGATAQATLNVTVNANTAPTLSYSSPQSASFGGNLNVSPATASDNGSITGYSVQSVVPALNTPPTVDSVGVVSISNAQPSGSHVITIRATDNCGLTTDAQFTLNVPSLPVISGHISYGDTTTPAPNVTLSLSAPSFTTRTATTDVNGNYVFTDVPLGNTYTLTPSKTGDVSGLEFSDASDVSQYVAGVTLPTANQQLAGDADGDGTLTSFDASLIARYVLALPETGIVGTWKFVLPSRTYVALNADQTNQNFTAILVGDTGGNWLPTLPLSDFMNGFKPDYVNLLSWLNPGMNPASAPIPSTEHLHLSTIKKTKRNA